MIDVPPPSSFLPNPPDSAGIVSWVHLGDLHMTVAGEQNHRDLLAMVDTINRAFAASIAFVYLPGDVADHGSAAEYRVVREAVDRLEAPWCAIVGDHDVHEKSFESFLRYMAKRTRYSFEVGATRFLAMNAFDLPDPGSFTVLSDQLVWLEGELRAVKDGGSAVVFLHCYPSDLKSGGGRIAEMLRESAVRLIDMGHTHYNELANDGKMLYAATRSTGQIEEGPVGFSVANLDGPVVSWKFFPLGAFPAVMITSPCDERLITGPTLVGSIVHGSFAVRAKVWNDVEIVSAKATFGDETLCMTRIAGSGVWETELDGGQTEGVFALRVTVTDAAGAIADDEIRVVVGGAAYRPPTRAERDQDNAIGAWPERGLLGSQLGPNKHGRKW